MAMSIADAAKLTNKDSLEILKLSQPQAWFSQLGQDRWAANYALPDEHMESPNHQKWYVEVGAADGLELSNTYALERMGWKGVCIEAQASSVSALRINRPGCIVVDAVVGPQDGEVVTFASFEDERKFLSGVASNAYFNAFGDQAEGRTIKEDDLAKSGSEQRVARTLSDLLDEAGAPTYVDFLSLDCEGLEAGVLDSFPWGRRSFGAIAVDHGYVSEKRARMMSTLVNAGYVRVGCLEHDDAFVPRSSLGAHVLGETGDILADTAESCDALMLTVYCADSRVSEEQAPKAFAVCESKGLSREECLSFIASSSAGGCAGGASYTTFPMVSADTSPGNFTLISLRIVVDATYVVFSFPMLRVAAHRKAAVLFVVNGFCARTEIEWEACERLGVFLQAGVEDWVTKGQLRALSAAGAVLRSQLPT
eukprot:CAMPEP_0172582870 /NCGR_PEP_ID=MMETSP1068-20121228/2416_1 /TAXON_ID=35684 /ORGANISM="Pseudopedinella elastica, Strain CCMP716" /LENGTH=422 /DNA_ID=CAMNT_0013376433 /DNA_START=208 /DNA_END=1476 /DNA_ORIENTATION=+